MTRAAATALLAALLTSCASSGIVPIDQGSYMISKQSAAGVFGTPNGVMADIYREATAFCEQRGQGLETVNAEAKSAIPFARQGSAVLRFRCVAKPT